MPITRLARKLWGQGPESKPKSIKELGKLMAQRILKSERDAGKAAAILLLTALDGAYNSVLVVSYFMSCCVQVLSLLRNVVVFNGIGSFHGWP